MTKNLRARVAGVASYLAAALIACGAFNPLSPAVAQVSAGAGADIQALCQPQAMQGVAATLSGVTVKRLGQFPMLPDGVKFTPARGALPAYCQVQGSFVTNPKTGKTANFLATFPANWNGKYLQIGCSGHCGQFFVSNPALPPITVTTQGYPSEIISKGYAAFATDEGHDGMASGEWAVTPSGQVDEDFVKDFYYRADEVLADMGKAFTRAFYTKAGGRPVTIAHSYFCGCSGGGRDAFVAAAYFPEKFDGIVAGSAYNLWGTAFSTGGISVAADRSPGADVPASLLAMIEPIVTEQCDALDGVKDGIIQNPAACNFRPERDLPRCPDDKPGERCFTKAQIQTVATILDGVTDQYGKVVQPGYSVSNFDPALLTALPRGGGVAVAPGVAPTIPLWEAALKIFLGKNRPGFSATSIFSFRSGGPGQVTDFHTVVPRAEVDKALTEGRMGDGHDPALSARLISENRKFLIWHDFSDEKLTPYMSINYYKRLAALHGGYAELQKNVRLFMLPAATHCSITSIGPNSFDALGAMETWVEKGQAPEALLATVADRQYSPGAPKAAALKYPTWTAKLCKFPEMAHYSGSGDLKNAANWSCPAGDTSLLKVGESGRQAGVVE